MKFIINSLFLVAIVLLSFSFTSCENDIVPDENGNIVTEIRSTSSCCDFIVDGNLFRFFGSRPGNNQFLILKYPDGSGSILNMQEGEYTNVYGPLCNVIVTYFWADDESYTYSESLNMVTSIFRGSQVERPGTITYIINNLCSPIDLEPDGN